VGQHPVLFLVPDRAEAQVAFVNAEGGLSFGQLDVGPPQILVAPAAHVAAQQITPGDLTAMREAVFRDRPNRSPTNERIRRDG